MSQLLKKCFKNYTLLLIIIVFFIFSSIFLNLKTNKSFLTGIGDIENSESLAFSKSINSNFEYLLSNNLVISIKMKDKESFHYLHNLEDKLKNNKEISDVLSNINNPLPFIDNNKNIYLLSINLKDTTFSNYESFTPNLRTFLSNNLPKDKFEYYVTGNGAFSYDLNILSEKQGRDAELKVLFITLIFTIILFGSIQSTILVILSAVITTILTITCLKLINLYYGLSIFSINISSMLGLGLSIDYSLILLNRYNKERESNSIEQSLYNTFNTASKTIFLSGLSVLVGFTALFIPQINLANSIAIGGVITIIFSMLVSNFVTLPSFAILDKKFKQNKKLDLKLNFDLFNNISIFIDKNKLILSLLSILLLILFSLPVLNMKLAEPSIDLLPDYCESKKGFKLINEASKGNVVFPILALAEVKKGNIYDIDNFKKIDLFTSLLSSNKKISEIYNYQNLIPTNIFSTISLVNIDNLNKVNKIFVSKDHKKALILIIPSKDLKNYQSNDLIKEIREIEVNNLNLLIGGPIALGYDLAEKLYERIIEIILFIYLITFLLLFISFKSILIPLKAIFLNTLSILASYGFLVLIFQYGYGKDIFNISQLPEAILSGIPVLLFCSMFSLSMDYEVFILSRVYEEYKKTYDNNYSVDKGLKETAGIILKAGSIMILVFLAFIQADIILIKMIGLGLSFAIFLDVTIVRLILVPSLMKLAGKYNWLEKPKLVNLNDKSK